VGSPPETPDASPSRPTAVVVDRQAPSRRSLGNSLREHGWDVIETEGWTRGLTLVGLHDPDLIVLDPDFTDGDGIAFIRDVRAWSRAGVLLLSARPDETARTLALTAGASDYLAKPVAPGELMARVARHRRQAPISGMPAKSHHGAYAPRASAPRREQSPPVRLHAYATHAAPLWRAGLRRVRSLYTGNRKPAAMPAPLRLILLVLLLVVLSAPMLVHAGPAERSRAPAGVAAGEPSAGVAIHVLPGAWGPTFPEALR